jgi:hypothetical protein
MAYQKSSYRRTSWRNVKPSDILPIWTTSHSDTANLAFSLAMERVGVTDVPTYFRKLPISITLCAVLGACIGLTMHGIEGFIVGTLAGMAAPAVLIWAVISLFMIAAYLIAYTVCMALVLWLAWWFLRGLLGG